MSENRLKFTKASLDKLPVPAKGKRAYYYDLGESGLVLCITGTGAKSFQVYRKVQGRPERITLGRYPALTIGEARKAAVEIKLRIARGENPNKEKRDLRRQATLDECFEQYLEFHAKPHKRTWREDQAQYQRYLEDLWGKRKLAAIERLDVERLHKQLGQQHGRYAANRLLALLRMVFGWAVQQGLHDNNPVQGIRPFREKSRERFLQSEELSGFFNALREESNHNLRDYVMLSLLTGARKSNVMAMRWQDVDFVNGVWHISETKNGTAQALPLLPEAIGILQARRRKKLSAQFVFPANSRSGHLVNPQKAWQKLLQRAGLEDLRLHDLRRSLGSWQAATGANLSVIGKTLNHKDMKSTAIYARLDLEPVREAMQQAIEAMRLSGGPLPHEMEE